MGVLRLNGKAYGGGIDVIEVTQAQYNALPESKLSDDILYVISDSVNGSDGYPPLIYSTEEREVGVWIDGKPLYQKTTDLGSVSANASVDITVGIGAGVVETVVNISVIGNYSTTFWQSLPFPLPSNVSSYSAYIDGYKTHTDKIGIKTGSDRDFTRLLCTIKYTKTTDTKGSGRWTTQGTLAQHYSTTERLIGTWIDGKPLYEKTISYIASTSIGVHDIETLSSETNVVKIEGIGIYQDQKIPIPYYGGNNDYYLLWTDGTKLQEYRGSANGFSGTQMYVTIQYTKTTD